MIEDPLEKVKDAENRAAKLIEEASQEKEKIISEAKKKALNAVEEAEAYAIKEREKLLEKLRKELEEEKKKKLETNEFSIKKLKSDAKNKISKEVSFLYEKFLEAVG